MEIVIGFKIALNAIQVDKDIVELLEEEETTGHALSAWNGIAFGCRSANKLEELLGSFEMITRIFLLTIHQIRDSLYNIFTGVGRL